MTTADFLNRQPSPGYLRRLCTRLLNTAPLITLSNARVQLQSVRPYIEDCGGGMGLHSHSYSEAIIFLQGSARLLPDATPLTGGDVLVHSPQRLHAWEPLTRVTRVVFGFHVQPPMALPSPLFPDDASTIVADLLRAMDEAENQCPGWQDRVRALLTLIFSTLFAAGSPLRAYHATVANPPGNLATEVDQYLRDNLAHPIRLADLAGHLGMCERSLTLHYRRLTGESIMTRLRHIRMETAQTLLLSTDESLTEIGRRVGMTDPSYLCRCFKEQFGHSPRCRNSE